MPTTADIYHRLISGASISVLGAFQEPAAGPTAGTGKTLSEIGGKLPAPDNSNGAVAGEVAAGKTFWGLRTDGTWGLTIGSASAVVSASGTAAAADVLTGKTFSNGSATGINGAMANHGALGITPGTAAQTIPAGYHNGAGSVAGDANLVAGNIKSGASIFGVGGSSNVVDTTEVTAAATAADISIGKKAYVNGVLVTGTLVAVNACTGGWSGINCNIIAKPFPSTVPSYASTPWKCVSDSATGLVWEVKTTDGGLHDRSNTYTWYDSAFTANPGTANGGTCNGSGCDTEKFVAAVNAEQLCGYTNWRKPSISELQGLVVLGSPPTPNIDTAYFPNTVAGYYWSGSSDATVPSYAWIVSFYDGSNFSNFKTGTNYVRLVRGGP